MISFYKKLFINFHKHQFKIKILTRFNLILPILHKNNVLCHFAHIPKCAGSSIENYCQSVGINIAFIDRAFIASPAAQPWNVSSPQHIDGYSLSRLFPIEFFNFGFAVVRDPVSRIVSAFKHQIIQKKIPEDTNLSEFIKQELNNISGQLGVYDNHFLPQTKFLIPGMSYQIYKLENGLDNVSQFIDSKFQNSELDKKILHYNADRSKGLINPSQALIDDQAMDILKEVYKDDFIKLGY